MKKWIFISIILLCSLALAGPADSNAINDFQNSLKQLHLRISELLKIIESRETEIARLRKICEDAGIDTASPVKSKPEVILPEKINEPFYGIYLGETFESLSERAKITKSKYVFADDNCPAKVWLVKNKDPKIKSVSVCTFNERVYEIDVEFKNASEADCREMNAQLEKDYPAVYAGRYEKLLGKSTFETTIDNVRIGIILNCDAAAGKNSTMKLTYVHMPLLEQMQSDMKK